MSEKVRIKLCDFCEKIVPFKVFKIEGSFQEAKCDSCKKKRPCYLYSVKTKGDE